MSSSHVASPSHHQQQHLHVLQKPAILRHVIKYAVQPPSTLSPNSKSQHQVWKSNLDSLIPFLQVCVDWRDTIENYSVGTISISLFPKDNWSFIKYFHRVCTAMNRYTLLLTTFRSTPSYFPNESPSDHIDKSEFLLSFVIEKLMYREWTQNRMKRPRALGKRLANENMSILQGAVLSGNVELIRFTVDNLEPNLDAECVTDGRYIPQNTFIAACRFSYDRQVAAEMVDLLAEAYLKLEERRSETFSKRRPRKAKNDKIQKKLDKDSTHYVVSRYYPKNRRCACLFDEPGILFPRATATYRQWGDRPLIHAISFNNVGVVKLLLNKFNCCPNEINDEHAGPLFTTGTQRDDMPPSLQMMNAILFNTGPYPVDLFSRPFVQASGQNNFMIAVARDNARSDQERKYLDNLQFRSAAQFVSIPTRGAVPREASDGIRACEMLNLIFDKEEKQAINSNDSVDTQQFFNHHEQLQSLVLRGKFRDLCASGQDKVVQFVVDNVKKLVENEEKTPTPSLYATHCRQIVRDMQQEIECSLENIFTDSLSLLCIRTIEILIENKYLTIEKCKQFVATRQESNRIKEIVNSILVQYATRGAGATEPLKVQILQFLVEHCGLDLRLYKGQSDTASTGNLLHSLVKMKRDGRKERTLLEYVLSLNIFEVDGEDVHLRTPLSLAYSHYPRTGGESAAEILRRYGATAKKK